MDVDRRVAKRAAKHLGNITRAEARAFGLGGDQLLYRVHVRGWAEVLPGVYRLPGVPDTFESRLEATKLWLGQRGHFTGPTAAHIMKLHGIERPGRIEVAMHLDCAVPPGLLLHRLQPEDRPAIRRVSGLRVPEVERVLLDCAASLPLPAVGRAMDDALRRNMTTVAALRAFRDEHCGRGVRGSKIFRTLIAARDLNDEKVRTVFEARMLRILRRIDGLEFRPDFHVRVGSEDYFLDFYLPGPRIGLECHSRKWHDTERAGADVVRDRHIRSTGIELLYFSYEDVVASPRGTEEEIRAAIERRLHSFFSADPGRSAG